ncbi:MAG: glutamine--fructose-6-phosphate transaminase (isomerizing) [Candidatus Izemoplasmatales bacterium]|nr:glutamine--fructose-6-phosphate transaminase (isomerizing) [Candidatus Izemoplasmatales bacterium]MDD4988395.1 glutamine--fructose-6-phosphate transaminase (isomerizing) [Candidatus Izemoplasmatales bacterium]NLF49174.1 glutamine--fructose-6-phosphate transaminase (isomerizing) [Acholeplasmataceae bacterium]
MCGIVGYLGSEKASDIILSGLTKLEYRGYDSCGIFFHDTDNDRFITYKDKGRVHHLVDDFDYQYNNHLAIGHTRWATHGKPNQANSHPHFSLSQRFGIVHNGVIDNYLELTTKYLADVPFSSETDTEVIVNLIDYFSKTLAVEEAIRKTLSLLEGSYALLIIDIVNPDILYAAKNKSPLLVGVGSKGIIIASDVMALVGYADHYLPLEDKSVVTVSKTENQYHFELKDIIGKPLPTTMLEMNIVMEDIGKAGYSHYMLKEICEQPSVIRKIMAMYLENGSSLPDKIIQHFQEANRIYIVAAGTSMHAGFVGKYLLENIAQIPVEVFIASEFAYNPPLVEKNPYFVFISQSGETADLRSSLVWVKSHHYQSLTITNVPTSTLAREADDFLEIYAGPEIAVASTKAYVAQVAILLLIAYQLASRKPFDIHVELSRVAVAMDAIIDRRDYIQHLVRDKLVKHNCFYIGRGLDYFTCLEAALKLKEISYIQTEGFAAGELKHGTITLIEEGTPVIAVISQKTMNHATRGNIREVQTRGAEVIVISMSDIHDVTDQIVLMDVHEYLAPLITVIPTQLIAFYTALILERDIDKPRNLAKSVTVE